MEMTEDGSTKSASYIHLKRPFYARFDLDTFHNRVEDFWSLDFSEKTNDVVKEVERTLSIGEDFVFPFGWTEYLPDSKFWRVRGVSLEKLQAGITESDLWEAPQELVPAGRLNLSTESLLYTGLGDPSALMHEARLGAGNYFILMRYRLTKPMCLKQAGLTNTDHDLTAQEQHIETVISGFVRDVLSIPAERHGPAIYNATQQVLRNFYPLAPEEDGWTYESTLMRAVTNAAIEPEAAHAKLAITKVIAGYVDYIDQNNDFYTDYRAYSDGQVGQGDRIEFASYPKGGLPSLEDYIEWPEYGG